MKNHSASQRIKIKNALFISIAALTIFGLVGYGTAKVYADNNGFGGHETIIQKLVERFGLNQDEVEAVFDEIHEEREQQMQARHEDRLNEAVSSGEITEEQKQLILTKLEEIHEQKEQNMEAWQSMTQDERREQKQTQRTEMQEWAETNGIDLKYLFGGFGMKGGHMGGMKGGFGLGTK